MTRSEDGLRLVASVDSMCAEDGDGIMASFESIEEPTAGILALPRRNQSRRGLHDSSDGVGVQKSSSGREPSFRSPAIEGERQGVRWQWLHSTGFVDFSEAEIGRIESYYRAGYWMMRLRSGRGRHARPREIYFYDLVQHDSVSGKARRIQRVPALSCWGRQRRNLMVLWHGVSSGQQTWWRPTKMDDVILKRQHTMAEPEPTYNNKCTGRLVQHHGWAGLGHFMICFNAVWMMIDTNENDADSVLTTAPGWIVMDNFFCLYFFVELLIRWLGFYKKRNCYRDNWFVFDCILVVMQVLETWVLSIVLLILSKVTHSIDEKSISQFHTLRAFRLLRIVRLTRLFKIIPQLMVLLNGIGQAMKSLLYTLILLVVLTFMFACVFKNFADGNDAIQNFSPMPVNSVADAFWMMLIYGVFMDAVGEMLLVLLGESYFWGISFLAFIFLSNLTMLNMLIGILCEVISRVTTDEKDVSAKRALEKAVLDLLECYDLDEDKVLRHSEFLLLMENPDMQCVLEDNNIDINDLLALEDILFDFEGKGPDENPKVSWKHFLAKVTRLQGGTAAKVTDIVELRDFMRKHVPNAPAHKFDKSPSMRPGNSRTWASSAKATRTPFEEEMLSAVRGIQQNQEKLQSEVCAMRSRMDTFIGQTTGPRDRTPSRSHMTTPPGLLTGSGSLPGAVNDDAVSDAESC